MARAQRCKSSAPRSARSGLPQDVPFPNSTSTTPHTASRVVYRREKASSSASQRGPVHIVTSTCEADKSTAQSIRTTKTCRAFPQLDTGYNLGSQPRNRHALLALLHRRPNHRPRRRTPRSGVLVQPYKRLAVPGYHFAMVSHSASTRLSRPSAERRGVGSRADWQEWRRGTVLRHGRAQLERARGADTEYNHPDGSGRGGFTHVPAGPSGGE